MLAARAWALLKQFALCEFCNATNVNHAAGKSAQHLSQYKAVNA